MYCILLDLILYGETAYHRKAIVVLQTHNPDAVYRIWSTWKKVYLVQMTAFLGRV